MTLHKASRSFAGIVALRAGASDPNAALADLNKAFAEFKSTNDANLKQRDALNDEKLDRINAAMTDMEATLKALQASAAVNGLGGGSTEADKAKAEYGSAFNKWMRRGDRAGADLGELAVKAALTTDSNPDGGYVVTPEIESGITSLMGVSSAMRGLAEVMTIGTDEYKKLFNLGGAGHGWVGEKESRPETGTPTLAELGFNTFEIYANPAITQKALDDANIDLAAWLQSEVGITFAEQEGGAFITGDGIVKPKGMLSYQTVANASWAWGKVGFIATGGATGFAASDPADAFIDTYYALKAGYRNGASWLTSDAVMPTIRKMKDADGNYLWAPPQTSADVPTILQKPVVTDDNMPALAANAFPVAFGDFRRGYLILDRMGVRVLRDPFTNKPYVHFYSTKRVGGGIQNYEAIKLMKCAA